MQTERPRLERCLGHEQGPVTLLRRWCDAKDVTMCVGDCVFGVSDW
jgi:hypothetical protein